MYTGYISLQSYLGLTGLFLNAYVWSFKFAFQMNWVLVTNSNFVIHISLQPDGVNLWYFKLRLLDQKELTVWNIKSLQHRVAKI